MEVGKFRQYTVKMDGSGRLAQRNRRHLQKIHKPSTEVPHIPPQHTSTQPPVEMNNRENDSGTTPQTDQWDTPQSNTHVNTQHFLRRSQRATREPDRYTDERCRR
jgi:hypothetical protein